MWHSDQLQALFFPSKIPVLSTVQMFPYRKIKEVNKSSHFYGFYSNNYEMYEKCAYPYALPITVKNVNN